MEIPEPLQEALDDAVRRGLSTELNARGLLLGSDASASATADAARLGAALLHRTVAHCYQDSRHAVQTMAVEFEGDGAAARVKFALAFGEVTASLLTPPKHSDDNERAESLDLLCAVFNLGIGLIDGLCDRAPDVGLPLLQMVQAMDLRNAAREQWARGTLRSALPTSFAADPTVAFTARVIEAFFDLLHSVYPGEEGSTLRRHVGAELEAALEAERQSVDRGAIVRASRDQLIECSRRTSVLPFQIIEQLATGEQALPQPTAGTLLGEAMWRIDDLVDLSQDARVNALNGILLAATEDAPSATSSDLSVVAALERVLTSRAIPAAAARAAEYLDAGLEAAGAATVKDRRLFLSFVQSYARIAPSAELRRRP